MNDVIYQWLDPVIKLPCTLKFYVVFFHIN